MTEKGGSDRFGFLDALERLIRPTAAPEPPAPPPAPQREDFARFEVEFETALRKLRERVAEQRATAAPVSGERRKSAAELAAEKQHRKEACHRAMREDIEKMHVRLATGLSPSDIDSLAALLHDLDADATEGRNSYSLMPRLRYTVGSRFRVESAARAVARLVALMKRANLPWPDPTRHAPHASPEEIERSRRRRVSETRDSMLAQRFKTTAERMVGVVGTWGADYPDRGSPLWEETVLQGVAAGISGQLLKKFIDLVDRHRDLVLSRTQAAIGTELAALQAALAGGVHSIEQANAVVTSSLHALDEVVPELVWQIVLSLLPEARDELAL